MTECMRKTRHYVIQKTSCGVGCHPEGGLLRLKDLGWQCEILHPHRKASGGFRMTECMRKTRHYVIPMPRFGV
jgi:hypothetical protein